MDNWRRTHYSFQGNGSQINKLVIVMGWISSKRDHGNVLFIQLRDKFGDIQIVVKKKDSEKGIFEVLKNLKEHSSIGVKGKIVEQKRSSDNVEVIPQEIKVLSISTKAAPFLTQAVSTIGIDTRLELRALDLRRNYLQNVFKIRFTILNSIREFLTRNYFIEVNTPKMIATATEGGAALFPIFYYDREAFLAQSPQLYKEQLTMAFENVFEIAPIFRAEPSRTNRHLSEAISIDIEKAFVDYTDMMALLETIILHIIVSIKEKKKNDLQYLDLQLPSVEMPFPKYSYSTIIDQLQSIGERIRWGDDLSPQTMKNLSDKRMNGFYFITDWPTSLKPFYVKPKYIERQEISESFDLMYGSLELSSGSTRINRKEELLQRMKMQGLNIQAFDYHLRLFDYGVPPHAGFGVGLERLLMAITRIDNIRDLTLYPRDIDRLVP